ncbi:MAG TPA: SpoIIE family protein phosphatase [Bryobacteraceae bacterium]|nr:SpoIIE family protein phosphatase [Bryobacteraceae bacterium]
MPERTSPATRKTAVRFRERAELLDFLLGVADATSETLDLDRLLANVAAIVKEVVPSDLFAILLYSEKAQGLRIRYSIGHRDEVVRNFIIRLGEGITGTAAATRLPVMVQDVRSDPRYISAVDAVRSELAVPMVARSKLVGVIDVQSTQVGAYTDHDRSLLRLIASRVAVSIDNARLYRRVERNNRTLRVLAHLSQEFSSILDLDELLGKIAKTIRALINYDAFSVMLVDAERKVLRHRFSVRYDQRIDLDNIPLGKGITGAAAESREAIRVNDTLTDPRYIASHPEIRSEVAVPLIVHDRVVGVMDLESERIAYFTDDHVRMLSLLAPQIASSVENARLYEELNQREQRMEQDLKAARKLQSVLLPRHAPEIRGLETAIRARAARDVTGDVYDFFDRGDGKSVLAFGDVSGKGAAAALYGALVSGLLRILAPQLHGPAELLRSLNDALLERKVDAQYATLLILVWDSATRTLTMSNAGSEPPIICRNGELTKPRVEGVPIGLLEDRDYEEVVYAAKSGDVLLLYSDGIEDQLNAAGEEFGRGRIARAVQKYCALPPRKLVDALFQELDQYMAGAPITDDQTLIALRVR